MASRQLPRNARLDAARADTVEAVDAARAAAAAARYAMRRAADIAVDMVGTIREATRAVGYNDGAPAGNAMAGVPALANALAEALPLVRASIAAHDVKERVYRAECRIRFKSAADSCSLLRPDDTGPTGERTH